MYQGTGKRAPPTGANQDLLTGKIETAGVKMASETLLSLTRERGIVPHSQVSN